jgi:precorrin-2 dehydrogenase/sirohydrochlorin ferrochelatase
MQIPIMYELSGKKVLVIGGGKTAFRIITRLKEFYASVTCVSKAFEPKFKNFKSVTCIEEIIRHHQINKDHFINTDMVIATTNNIIVNERIYKYCRENSILCMTTHKMGPKDFDFMELIEKNGLLLAASTHGANPVFSSEILATLMDTIDEETFKRLEMLMEEKKLILSLKNK